jgi:Tol biopolymer transport system component
LSTREATREAVWPLDWSPDGRFVLYGTMRSKTGADMWTVPLDGDRKAFPVAQAEYYEDLGQFSPDMRWIVYQSNASGSWEVYLQGFPNPGSRSQVSTRGGSRARWRRDGKEIFYLSPEGKMMAVDFQSSGTTVEIGRPRELFQAPVTSYIVRHSYDVSADGQRFLINTMLESAAGQPITMVTNWAAEVRSHR